MERSAVFDRYKGLLIVLVVLGHVLGAAYHICMAESGCVYQYGFKLIYSFHMPAFFVVAGMLYREHSDFLPLVKKRFMRLIVPYFSFGVITFCIYTVLGALFVPQNDFYSRKLSGSILSAFCELIYGGPYKSGMPRFVYNSVLWFLPTMFCVSIIYYWLDKLRKKLCASERVFDFFLFVGAVLIHWFFLRKTSTPLPWEMNCVVYYLSFFCAGRIVAKASRAVLTLKTWHLNMLWLGLLAVLIVACWSSPNQYLANYRFQWYIVFIVIALIGTAASFLMTSAIHWGFLEYCGRASLAIMLMHKPCVMAMQFACPFFRSMYKGGILLGLLATACITIVSVVLCLAADKLIIRTMPWLIGANRRSVKTEN